MKPSNERDVQLLQSIHEAIKSFVISEAQMQELQPMPSFERRMVHEAARSYQVRTESVGEEERFICLIRTEQSHVPEHLEFGFKDSSNITYDFGDQIFYAKPNTQIALFGDGSVGVHQGQPCLDSKIIVRGDFCIRKSRIISPPA